ncbi:hypothetical protein V5F38_12685 [Xanthobacter sp. V0B-10]|uniref:hypothetical protein n=1 Tax=Xanthobacter albus TaxID=3119929 RepID=UPI00372A9B8E
MKKSGADAGGRRAGACARRLAVLVVALLAPLQALAHRGTAPGDRSGLEIAGVTHGEMAVIAGFAPAIRAVAQNQTRTDPTFRRLANFAALQRTYCLWGLMPGSVSDEDSPFNACMHAYLSALRAVLVHMRDMPGRQDAALQLDQEMTQELARHAAFNVICQYSSESFNTAQVIIPEWRDIARHPPSLLAAGAVAAMLGAAGAALFRRPRAR